MNVSQWMSWEGGADLVAVTDATLSQPNIIVHVARMVHTPVGSAPSGLILLQPDANQPPQIMGFVSGDPQVGAYFGPHIFAGTPFENAPVLKAKIEICDDLPNEVATRIEVEGMVIETRLNNVGQSELIHREIGALPFVQQGVEAAAQSATLKINGEEIQISLPPQGISGGAAAVWAPCGIYAR
jgi:hypothetical protein